MKSIDIDGIFADLEGHLVDSFAHSAWCAEGLRAEGKKLSPDERENYALHALCLLPEQIHFSAQTRVEKFQEIMSTSDAYESMKAAPESVRKLYSYLHTCFLPL